MIFTDCANKITTLQREAIILWKKDAPTTKHLEPFFNLVEENHSFNYQLWHAEDKARRDDLGFEFVYRAKRDIDHYNQQRNNRMEAIDTWLLEALNPPSHTVCPVHSETPGMIIDRLSILALKHYHMALQTTREDVEPNHIARCQEKLLILSAQHQQLETCLQIFINQILDKQRTFRVYHQFKMYNDPSLNPELYKNREIPN